MAVSVPDAAGGAAVAGISVSLNFGRPVSACSGLTGVGAV